MAVELVAQTEFHTVVHLVDTRHDVVDEGHAVIVVAVAHQLVEEVGLEERDASLQAGG